MTFTIVLLLFPLVAVRAQGADCNLYAVLINGGRNRLTNHERYWNDCSFLYRTLRQTFHIPKRNITVLMSDGGAPEEDMLRADARGFASSSPDLDGDGQSDIDYPATELARDGVSREVPCSALKGETVPDSLPATPKSPPTRRVPPRGTPRVPAPLPLSPFSPPDRDRRGDSPAWSGRGSRPSRRTSG